MIYVMINESILFLLSDFCPGSPEMFMLVIHILSYLLLLISLPEISSQPIEAVYRYNHLEIKAFHK